VEMASGLNSSVNVPGDRMEGSWSDCYNTDRANPTFALFRTGAVGLLHLKLTTALVLKMWD